MKQDEDMSCKMRICLDSSRELLAAVPVLKLPADLRGADIQPSDLLIKTQTPSRLHRCTRGVMQHSMLLGP